MKEWCAKSVAAGITLGDMQCSCYRRFLAVELVLQLVSLLVVHGLV
jgi:hypothetical protein